MNSVRANGGGTWKNASLEQLKMAMLQASRMFAPNQPEVSTKGQGTSREEQIRTDAVVLASKSRSWRGPEIHGGEGRRSSPSGRLVERSPPQVLILHCDMIRIAKVDRRPSRGTR